MPIFWESDHSELTYVLHASFSSRGWEQGEVIDRLLETIDAGDPDLGVI